MDFSTRSSGMTRNFGRDAAKVVLREGLPQDTHLPPCRPRQVDIIETPDGGHFRAGGLVFHIQDPDGLYAAGIGGTAVGPR